MGRPGLNKKMIITVFHFKKSSLTCHIFYIESVWMKEAEGLLYLLDLVAIVALNVSLHFHNLQPENKDFKLKITSKNGFIKYLFT